MPSRWQVITPLGTFTSVKDAAQAHQVDRATITQWFTTRADQYQRRDRPRPPVIKPTVTSTGNTAPRRSWPLTWSDYRVLDWDTREQIWQKWCRDNDQDPEQEGTGDRFFDAMDGIIPEGHAQDEEI